MRVPGAATLMVIAALVGGCASGPVPAGSPGPTGGSVAATPSPTPSAPEGPLVWVPDWADARTPAAVVNRQPVPFCGIEQSSVPQPGEFFDGTVRNCFWAAKLAQREAEFASVQSTIEGDPIATIYRLRPDGRVDLYVDATNDRYGSGGWTLTTCERLISEPGDRLFGVDGCGEAQPIE